jgi:hypothetical protein
MSPPTLRFNSTQRNTACTNVAPVVFVGGISDRDCRHSLADRSLGGSFRRIARAAIDQREIALEPQPGGLLLIDVQDGYTTSL